MFFDRYFINQGNIPNFKYLKLPLSHEQQYWSGNQEKDLSFITLDLMDNHEFLSVLISNPDWEKHKPRYSIESICSNLYIMMRAFGAVRYAKPVKWYFIHNASYPYKIKSIEFEEKDNWLFLAKENEIAMDKLLFDISNIAYLFRNQKTSSK